MATMVGNILFGLLIVVGLARGDHVFEITRDPLPEWLGDKTIEEMRNAYLNLDYNQDGFVSFGELKLGLVSILDNHIFTQQYDKDKQAFDKDISMKDEYWTLDQTKEHFEPWLQFKPESFSCVPTLEPIDFVDCMTLAARHESMQENAHMKEDSIVLFETALSMYLGHECSDVSPLEGTMCQELIETDTMNACKDSSTYCQLSCFQCKSESSIFGHNIRGTNDNVKENRVSSVYDPDNLEKHKKLMTPSHTNSNDNNNINENNHDDNNVMRRLLEEEETEAETEQKGKHVFHNLGIYKASGNDKNVESESSCSMSKREAHANSNRFFFISDVHVEPWYDVSGSGEVSRFDDVACTVSNMFECHDTSDKSSIGSSVDCSLNGESDPPFQMYSSSLQAINQRFTRIENSVLFFVGDLQAHDYTDNVESPLVQTMTSLQFHMLTETLRYFTTDQIFVTAGNNDGVHNSLFVNDDSTETKDVSRAWAQSLITKDIVNNDLNRKYTIENTIIDHWSQTDVFKTLGYYMKQLPEHGSEMANTYVLVLNTNLGSSNYIQNAVLTSDLEWVSKTKMGKAIILAHHPTVVTSMIADEYLKADFILGIFSGHVHYFSETDDDGFTILPALSQYSYVNGFASTDFDKNGKLSIDESGLLVYNGYEGETANFACWSRYES